jgi:nitrate/TMAO reductase-like tetraheme cytochrome c subunit
MFKRVTIVALVVAAFLVLAVPAMAWNGLREDYTTSEACQTCHSGIAGIPATYQGWSETKHGETGITANRAPYGSVCSGCHSSNFDPSKPTPTPSGTTYAWANATPIAAQALGTASVSENGKIGCSACHYGANVAGGLEIYGVDSNDTAHNAPYGELANADICGACHSRYSYTVDTYAVNTIPGAATPTPLIQPQMALGYPMLGSPAPSPATGWTPAAPLAAYLNVPHPGWTPTPDPSATSAAGLMTFWQMPADGTPSAVDTMWQAKGHDGSASQYPEWANEGHANALTALTSMPFWASFPEATKQECLECHSADFRIMKESGKNPTSADVKYGVTCVGCHTPHEAGDITGVWDEEFDAQLVNNDELGGNGSNLCTECHNGEIPAGSTASPGAEVHHPMKEMMDGYGAIDVAAFPSVHKGKCIQCHMAPTAPNNYGGNHTFTIIEPEVANEVVPTPVATTTVRATALPIPGTTNLPVVTTTVTTQMARMPYSACSTCHDNNQKPAQQISSSSATSTPTAAPTTVQVTVTRSEMVATGDKGLWLQDTIDQRQEWTIAKVDEIHAELAAAAGRLGYADEAAAHEALVAIPAADRTFGETNFLKAFTNVGYVESEGSFGLHNWDYSRAIVNAALNEARAVQANPPQPRKWVVTMKASKTSVSVNKQVKFRGLVMTGWSLAGSGTLTLQKKVGSGAWKKWTTVKLDVGGGYGKTMKMTQKGTIKVRGYMPGDGGLNLAAYSTYVTVKVK